MSGIVRVSVVHVAEIERQYCQLRFAEVVVSGLSPMSLKHQDKASCDVSGPFSETSVASLS